MAEVKAEENRDKIPLVEEESPVVLHKYGSEEAQKAVVELEHKRASSVPTMRY